MAPLDDARHKGGGAGFGDFVLGLVAHPATLLNVVEDGFAVHQDMISKLGEMIFMHLTPL